MKKAFTLMIIALLAAALLPIPTLPASSQATSPQVVLLDSQGNPASQLTDGDQARLRITLPDKATQTNPVTFQLTGSGLKIAECSIAQGQESCETADFTTLGWYWGAGGTAQPSRTIEAFTGGAVVAESAPIQLTPRPVVMVHGFSSSWQAWQNYVGPQGFLASAGIRGFAVGDGQVPGVLNTGSLTEPTGRTNTIAENADILRDYIAQVKLLTGAQKVDLMGHSMGGLISRYYIDRVMPEGEVAQLIMLGSPMLGTECANLPAALGFYLPATLEIQPMYVQDIFNPQITHRHGIPFHALAGIPIVDAIQSPCTLVPSDLAVSRQSVSGIPLDISETPILHTELNTSQQVFNDYVLPLLKTLPDGFQSPPDPAVSDSNLEALQFTRMYTGHLNPGETQELTINIEANVTLASFALYDTSRSLNVEVRGASGKVLVLDPSANGLIKVDNPESMIYLGYGFKNPKPGAWHVTLQTTASTSPSGADYALTAVFQGGAVLHTETNALVPQLNEPVQVTAWLELDGQPLPIAQAQAVLRSPDGSSQSLKLELAPDTNEHQATWTPTQSGLYSLQISVSGQSPDGLIIERTGFLTVEAQPTSDLIKSSALVLAIGLVLLLGVFAMLLVGITALVIRARRSAAR